MAKVSLRSVLHSWQRDCYGGGWYGISDGHVKALTPMQVLEIGAKLEEELESVWHIVHAYERQHSGGAHWDGCELAHPVCMQYAVHDTSGFKRQDETLCDCDEPGSLPCADCGEGL